MPVIFTETVTLLGAVPLAELKFSQVALSVAVQLSVPVPPLVIASVWLAGLEPLWAALKLKREGLTAMDGPAGPIAYRL